MNDFTKIVIAAIMGYSAYKIAVDFNNTLIAIRTVKYGMILEENKKGN